MHQLRAFKNRSGFTLIELLVVIAIIMILAVIVFIIIDPNELVRQARDTTRLSTTNSIKKMVSAFKDDKPGVSFGTPYTIYASVPDPTATTTAGTNCSGIPYLSPPYVALGWTYHCANPSTLQKTDGTGWMPINFQLVTSGAALNVLPIDPINTATSGQYYAFAVGPNNSWAFTMPVESTKYGQQLAWNDGGVDDARYEISNDAYLWGQATGLVGLWRFDDGSGTVARDESGYGNDLTIAPGASMVNWATGKKGGGIAYSSGASIACTNDGFGIYLNNPKEPLRSITNSSSFTVLMWTNNSASSNYEFTLKNGCNGGSTAHSFQLGGQSPGLYRTYTCYGGGAISGSYSPYYSGAWHLYSYETYVSSTQIGIGQFIIDAKNDPGFSLSHIFTPYTLSDSYGFTLGIDTPSCVSSAAGATFDEVRIYNRMVSKAELKPYYNLTK